MLLKLTETLKPVVSALCVLALHAIQYAVDLQLHLTKNIGRRIYRQMRKVQRVLEITMITLYVVGRPGNRKGWRN